jgi:hypothetical protein
VQAVYFESQKSFYKLSLELIIKKISTLVYIMKNINLKDELLNYFLLNKWVNEKKTIVQGTFEVPTWHG